MLKDLLDISGKLPASLCARDAVHGRLAPILYDYTYFKAKNEVESKMEHDEELKTLTDELYRVMIYLLRASSIEQLMML